MTGWSRPGTYSVRVASEEAVLGQRSIARPRAALALLLLACVIVRVVLVARGGQLYWPDEARYLRAAALLDTLFAGEPGAALDGFLAAPNQVGFAIAGLWPALVQFTALAYVGLPPEPLSLERTLWIPALPLSLASVACVGLLYAIARRAGAGQGEALLAAGLGSASASLLCYARHLLPYDFALALALAALWLGLAPRARKRTSLACGLAAGLAFLTYHGYWLAALAAGALHVARGRAPARERLARAALFGAGLLALPALLSAVSVARGLEPWVLAVARFSRQAATQTDFREGWSLPFAYLWHAEHGLLLAWGAGALGAGWLAARGEREIRSRARLWLGAAAGIYAALVLFSNGFERIGVFGRSARQLVPFLCLATAATACSARARRSRALSVALLAALVAQTAWNFAAPLAQRFPDYVLAFVAERYGFVPRAVTVAGTRPHGVAAQPWPAEPDPGAGAAGERYVLVNAQHFYPVRGLLPAPEGVPVLAWRHPLEYLPYQYEGYTPLERELLHSAGIRMRLVDRGAPPQPAPPPGGG